MEVSRTCFENIKNKSVIRKRIIRTVSATRNYTSVVDLAKDASLVNSTTNQTPFERIFEVYSANATCTVGEQLANKYNVEQDNSQFVVSIRNRWNFDQTWFNGERSNKPQNFKASSTIGIQDPTQNGLNCDFCDWSNLTAIDDFGRIEYSSVVSGSNLFKYCAPCHGVLVLKKHHPLDFDFVAIKELMLCTQDWLEKALEKHQDAKFPLFVWNCLARAGASQFHGHAQVMISPVPFPCYESLRSAKKSYSDQYPSQSYLEDLISAYEEVGLLKTVQVDDERSLIYPSLTPWKDMEVVIWTDSLRNESFHHALYQTLQTMIKEFGMQTFNVGIQGMELYNSTFENNSKTKESSEEVGPVMARIVSRGKLSSVASDFGGLEVFGGASIGHTDPFRILDSLTQNIETVEQLTTK